MIGFFDVKSSPVHFYAQRISSYWNLNTVIPFELLRLNVGNAMSLFGIFGAPEFGRYFFSFSVISEGNKVARVELKVKTETVDWSRIGDAWSALGHQTFSLQSTLDLAKGNQIRLLLLEGAIHDEKTEFIHILLASYSRKKSFIELPQNPSKKRFRFPCQTAIHT
jgi:hypothetical protein